jgi:hypothetical protein
MIEQVERPQQGSLESQFVNPTSAENPGDNVFPAEAQWR